MSKDCDHLTLDESIQGFRIPTIIKLFGQWAVTEGGIDCTERFYPIETAALHNNWLIHMREKRWVDYDAFKAAYQYALEYHKIRQNRASAKPPHVLDVPLPSRPFPHGLEYSTAKRLTFALLSIQAAYKVAKSWTPDTALAPAGNSQMYLRNVKEMGVVDGAWRGFAHTLDALLEGLGVLEMLCDRSIYEKLIESEWAQLSAWLGALLDSAYPVMRSPAENKPGSGDDDIDF